MMKKFFAALLVFTLLFSACNTGTSPEDEDEDKVGGSDNSDIIGTWTGSLEGTNTRLEISEGSYIFIGMGETVNGTWSRSGNTITATSCSSRYIGSIKAILTSTGTLVLSFNILYDDPPYPVSIDMIKAGNGGGGAGNTALTIDNQSAYPLFHVSYSSVDFGTIGAGQSVTKNVSAGTKNLLFDFDIDETFVGCRRAEILTVEEEKPQTVTIQNNTIIVVVSSDKQGGLKTIYDELVAGTKYSEINVERYTANVIAQQETIDLGSVRINTTEDFSFIIRNSGTADLTIESIDGNRINLSANASGFFSVVEQPFAGVAVAPGKTANFTIRFSPTAATVGSVIADVQIKTNSKENGDFVFRLRASGTDTYQIGDTGPGGGIVFYAQGGQYKECSADMGIGNWSFADTTANAFRGNGFSNWRLPNRAELDLVYRNIYREDLEESFLDDYYWSSETYMDYYNSKLAYYQNFSTGSASYDYASNTNRFFAVRAF